MIQSGNSSDQTKSTTKSSDDNFLMLFETVEEDQILAAFPDQMFTSEVHD